MKKKILLGLISIVLVLIVGAGVCVLNPGIQMKLMTTYVMKNLSSYNWSALQMEDPIKPVLSQAFGEENTESVDGLYEFLAGCAEEMQWEVTQTSPENGTVTLMVKYVDSKDFLNAYGKGLGDYLMKSIDEGTMKTGDVADVLSIISDEEHARIIETAKADVADKEPGFLETNLTINFQKKGMLFIPTGTSEEVNDVASAGLSQNLSGIQDTIATYIIPQIVERVFHSIQSFDEKALEEYTGKSMPELLGMKESDLLYRPIHDYLKACAGKIEYTVGEYNSEKNNIEIQCSYLDSKNVIKEYEKLLVAYVKKNWFNPIPSTEQNAEMLKKATENAKEKRVEKTVTITFNPENYAEFQVSKEIMDVVSANLNSR